MLPAQSQPPVLPVPFRKRARFGSRGQVLWDEMTTGKRSWQPEQLVLIEEACRLADRLERFHELLGAGPEGWVYVQVPDLGDARLVIDALVGEVRQSALAFKQIVGELNRHPVAAAAPGSVPAATPAGVASFADEARRRGRG